VTATRKSVRPISRCGCDRLHGPGELLSDDKPSPPRLNTRKVGDRSKTRPNTRPALLGIFPKFRKSPPSHSMPARSGWKIEMQSIRVGQEPAVGRKSGNVDGFELNSRRSPFSIGERCSCSARQTAERMQSSTDRGRVGNAPAGDLFSHLAAVWSYIETRRQISDSPAVCNSPDSIARRVI